MRTYTSDIVAQIAQKSEQFALTEHIFYSIIVFFEKTKANFPYVLSRR